METLYLIALLVGGFFVVLSLFGGSDADAEVEVDADVDVDGDGGNSVDAVDSGPGVVDLFSVRALFLFAAFFGLTGLSLSMLGTGEPWSALYAVLVGLTVGLGGNFVIKRVGYEHVSSAVSARDLNGLTGEVLVPFEGAQKGKISLVTRGHRLQLVARAFEQFGAFLPGDEVVVVRMRGPIAEVVRPD